MATPARQMLDAVLAGDAGTVAELLDADPQLANLADRGPDRSSVLHLAARRGYLAVVELLLAAGAAVSRWDHDGSTPLHEAALGGHLEVARVLLAASSFRASATAAGSFRACSPCPALRFAFGWTRSGSVAPSACGWMFSATSHLARRSGWRGG